jgi:hypothetical protein
MTSRRDLLAALVALAATPALARAPEAFAGLDPAAVQRIGKAWREQHPAVTAAMLTKRLFPNGRGVAALPRLREQAAADFRKGSIFAYRGWRLSNTEGALLALLSLEALFQEPGRASATVTTSRMSAAGSPAVHAGPAITEPPRAAWARPASRSATCRECWAEGSPWPSARRGPGA